MPFSEPLQKSRIFFVEPQEDIDELTEKLAAVKSSSIVLVIPHGAILLQSIISLKILRNNVEKAGKQIIVVTRDRKGRQYAEQLGIPAFIDLEQVESSPSPKKSKDKLPEPDNQPTEKRLVLKPFPTPAKKKPLDFEKKKIELLELLRRPSKLLLFSIVAVSLLLLLLVTTVVLPGATIRINPQKKVIEITLNVVLAKDVNENGTDSWRQQVVRAVPIESIFERSIPFETVTKNFTGKSAEGEIFIINNLAEEITLRPGSRFQNQEGIVFRNKDWVRIPPKSERSVDVIADERDAFGEFIGARGNVDPPQKLFLPGLAAQTQLSVYAEIRTPISGGLSGYVPSVTQKDFDIAKAQITETIVREAWNDAKEFVRRKNLLENTDYVLVPGEDFLDTAILEIEFPENIIGTNITEFPVRSRMRVGLLAFSASEMLSIFRGALMKSVDPGMELISVEDNGIAPEVLSISPKKDRIKITVTARGLEAYVIEPRTVGGVKFVNKVKLAVVGKPISEARKILENFQEVSDVQISVWPPVLRNLPSLPENISVRLLQ